MSTIPSPPGIDHCRATSCRRGRGGSCSAPGAAIEALGVTCPGSCADGCPPGEAADRGRRQARARSARCPDRPAGAPVPPMMTGRQPGMSIGPRRGRRRTQQDVRAHRRRRLSGEVGACQSVGMTEGPLDQFNPVAVGIGEPRGPQVFGAVGRAGASAWRPWAARRATVACRSSTWITRWLRPPGWTGPARDRGRVRR
jgi:hypothetical protein